MIESIKGPYFTRGDPVADLHEGSRLRRLAVLTYIRSDGPKSIEQVREAILPDMSWMGVKNHIFRLMAAGLLVAERVSARGTGNGPRVVYRATRRRHPLDVGRLGLGKGPTI